MTKQQFQEDHPTARYAGNHYDKSILTKKERNHLNNTKRKDRALKRIAEKKGPQYQPFFGGFYLGERFIPQWFINKIPASARTLTA